MKKYIILIILLTSISCEDYVTNIDKRTDLVFDEELNSESQFNFLIAGIKEKYSSTQSRLYGLSDGLSDQFVSHPGGNYSLIVIDNGEIEFDDVWVTPGFSQLGELRFFADDLVRRVNEIDVSDNSVKDSALFNGYLFGGIARYFYATYFALTSNDGGGVIDNGPFIPSSKMYDLAIEKFQHGLQSTSNDYEIRLLNSIIARTYIYKGAYENASQYAVNGLTEGDASFEALSSDNWGNFYYNRAGINEQNYLVHQRFFEYIKADSMETSRIQIEELIEDSVTIGYYQVKYTDWGSSIPHITWQENNLMRAELSFRGYGSGDPLQLVNEVRESHGLNALLDVDLDVIYEERDKELFCTGSRLPDQRRFNKWHLAPGKWQYLPISQDERDRNPNIN